MKMRLAKGFVAAGVIGCVMAMGTSARAQTAFASFSLGTSNATGSPFAFDSFTGEFYLTNGQTHQATAVVNGQTVSYTAFDKIDSVNVNFQFQTANAYGSAPGATIQATMSFDAFVNGAAAQFGGITAQSFQSIEMQFNAITPHDGLYGTDETLLLRVDSDSTASQTLGTFASSSPTTGSLQGSQTGGSGLVGFSSDFLDFQNPTFEEKDFSISLAGITPSVAINSTTGNLRSFVANGSGTFNSDPIPPTPATPAQTTAMIGLAMAGAQFGLVRLRRRRAVAAVKPAA